MNSLAIVRALWIPLLVAIAAYAGAHWLVRDLAPCSPARLARNLARPFVLPALWNQVEAADRDGDVATAAALGRDLIRYLPDWVDGHVHFAAWLAFDYGHRARSTDDALARLDAGLAWLSEARTHLAATHPQRAAELAAAQATFIQARAQQDPALAAAIRARGHADPSEIALGYLDAAIALADADVALRERRAILLTSVIAAAVRTDDMPRAVATLDTAITLLREVRDPEASIPWIEALTRIRPLLLGEKVELDRLRADPYLEQLIEAYESR